MFNVGEAVICVDASDIPSPPWKELTCGASYVIREIETAPSKDGLYDKNIYKNSKFIVRLWGVSNPIHTEFKKELAYSADRFERIDPKTVSIKKTETVGEKQ